MCVPTRQNNMPFLQSFTPLAEKAVGRDGLIRLKLIAPGWGSSGYYSREVLERDIPRVFPAGTHMYWNHPTVSEDMERPERDLSDLAAVTVTAPVYEENGPAGPGMYADGKVFGQYQPSVDDLAEHIGVSILGGGRFTDGEAEGKKGRLITEISSGRSVDFVTRPGAGGQIIELFEAAGRGQQAAEETSLEEAHNLAEWLESRLHLALTQIADDLFGDGRVTRDERKALSAAIGQALDAYHTALEASTPQLFKRRRWDEAPGSDDLMSESAGGTTPAGSDKETPMSDQELKEAQAQIAQLTTAKADSDSKLAEAQAAIARLQEREILREARDFVAGIVAEAELPDVTKVRLVAQLASNPPVNEGRLDEAKLKERCEAAVNEAKSELAAILGQFSGGSGQISGMGESAGSNGTDPAQLLEAARARQKAAMEQLGYAQPTATTGGNN